MGDDSQIANLAARFRGELIPITSRFSYFSTLPIAEEDLKQYLHDPIAAVSPTICDAIPPMGFVLVPYLEKANGKQGDLVMIEVKGEDTPKAVEALRSRFPHRCTVWMPAPISTLLRPLRGS